VLTVGAAEFQSTVPSGGDIESDGYLYFAGLEGYLARVSLPEGASITKMCLYAFDSDPGHVVETVLIAVKLVPGGESPGRKQFHVANSFQNVGYGSSCNEDSFTLRGKVDVDGDGILDSVAYYVSTYVYPHSDHPSLGFGGVQITWKRQVSPPPATPTFGDVPASDPAFAYVEALAASGITAGCAGGNYCPDASLTRRQMAVFLAKALGLHWID
jgi:hypothetical protein